MRQIITLFLTLASVMTFISCENRSANLTDKGTWVYLKPGEKVDGYQIIDNKVYGITSMDTPEEYYKYLGPLKGIDSYSFKVCPGTGYAKDFKHVLYPVRLCCVDGYFYGATYMEEYIVKGADPETFKYIGDGYGVDCRNLYYQGEKVPWNQALVDSLNRLP